MSISFSDDDLRATSKIILSTPAEITSLNDQKANVLLGKADALTKDNANKTFYQNYKTIIEAYFDEIKNISGITYTKYQDSYLDDSAKVASGNIHYPSSPIWVNFSPKSVNANVGLPTTNASDHEDYRLAQLPIAISQLKTGFTDGAQSSTSTASYAIGGTFIEVPITGFVIGNRISVTDGSRSMLATITGTASTPTPRLLITVQVAPSATINSGATVRNFHSGFTNTQRESGVTTYPEIFTYWKGLIDGHVTNWNTFLGAQLTALNLNVAVGSEATDIASAITKVNSALSVISTWQSAPSTGTGVGRYGDATLSPLESKISARLTEATAREAAIVTALGSVAQNADGTFSGTNNFYKFFQWIDFRISKSVGTLFSYYNFDMIIKFIDDKIVKANAKKAEYDSYMIVKKIVVTPDGTNVIKVEDTVGLSLTNIVKILDDTTTPITTATIIGISGQFITLSSPISGYVLDQSARLVRLL